MSGTPDSQTGPATRQFFRDRTADGWPGFVEHYGRTIRRWCRASWRLGDEEADDLTALVVVKLWQKMVNRAALWDPGKGRFHAWLRTVALRAWLDARDERRRALGPGGGEVRQLLENDAVGADFVEQLAQADLLEVAQERARARVSATEWEVFRLRLLANHPAEVAGQLRLTVGTVNNYTSKVRAILKEELERLTGPGE
jgi:RNA polymerase sigma factor (sigma-70 family)